MGLNFLVVKELLKTWSLKNFSFLSRGVGRFFAAQGDFQVDKTLGNAGSLVATVFAQTIRFHGAIEKYLSLRKSGVVTARR